MALQINKEFNNGVIAPECYVKITNICYSKISSVSPELTGLEVTASFYFNKAARDNDSVNHLEQNRYVFPDFVKETRELQYEYLKTLDDFSEAINV